MNFLKSILALLLLTYGGFDLENEMSVNPTYNESVTSDYYDDGGSSQPEEDPIVFTPRQFDVLEMPIGNGFLFDSSGLIENGYRLPVRMGEFYAVDPDVVKMNGLGAIVQAIGIKEGNTTLVFNIYNWKDPSYSVDVHIPVTVVSSVYGW